MVYKAVALTRLVRPDANIPSTTALATINKHNGRELGLQRGANVLMPNLTPVKYRQALRDLPGQSLHRGNRQRLQRLPASADCSASAGTSAGGRAAGSGGRHQRSWTPPVMIDASRTCKQGHSYGT